VSASSLVRLEQEIAALAGRLAPPPPPMTALEVAAAVGIVPDPWQGALLRSDARQIIMCCSRQSGKSTITSIVAAHQAVAVPNSLTLIVSPSLRQSGELYAKVRSVLVALGTAIPPATQETATTLRLANGSRVVSLPGSEKTIRGFSAPDLVIEDESARVDDETHQALRPMLAVSAGRMILLSTPFGRRGHFFETWSAGGPSWERVRITADDVPRIDPAWLEQERAAIGSWWFEQEFLCVFKDATDAYFRSEDIDAASSTEVRPLFGGMIDAA